MEITNEGNEDNIQLLPYKLCRIVKGANPYLVFYVYSEITNKLVRMRKEPPKGENQRIWFIGRINYFDNLLVTGFRIVKPEILQRIAATPDQYTILQALEEITQIRNNNNIVRESSRPKHKSFQNIFEGFLRLQKLDSLGVSKITKSHLQNFIDTRQVGATTKNNYLAYVKAIFASFLDKEWITENPAVKIKKFKQQESNSIAFASEHLPQLKAIILQESSELYIFSMFIFYTFIRPIELRRLFVSDVDLTKKKILIKGMSSKNARTRYVVIPKQFEDILVEYKFLDRPKTDKLFELNNTIKYSKNYYSELFRKVLDKNNFPKAYKMYGWKHTGVVEYYKNGAGLKFIKEQCRHASIDETDKYLKSLGLFENEEIMNNAPEI